MSNSYHLILRLLLIVALLSGGNSLVRAADPPAAKSEKETALLEILRSDKAPGDKALACKQLAIYGSGAAAKDLAGLLSNPELSSWARIALEAIPGPEADEALLTASQSLDGRLLVGVLNSLGVRRVAAAVPALIERLKDSSVDVASAAAVALGRIGNPAATQALQAALATSARGARAAVGEGCVLCAERLLADGKAAEAAALYDAIRAADIPKPRVVEATRGAILARGKSGIPLLLEQIRATDKAFFHIGLSTARELPGAEVDQALAAELAKTPPERAALLIHAMADRPDTVILSAIVTAASQGPKPVRLAALTALSRVGDASSVPTLLDAAIDADAELAESAQQTLADLPGAKVDEQISARLSKAEGKQLSLLLDLVGKRRIDARPALLKALDHTDPAVRSAALKALGETITAKELPVLIAQVIAPKNTADAAVAQQALKAASIRMEDRESCAGELSSAYNKTSLVATKISLLQIMAEVGGSKSLATLASAAKTNDAQLQDASTRLLGEWMTADAAPVLLDLTKTAPGEKYQVRALRGYIRIARQFVLPETERAEMCQKALAASQQPAEQKLVLEVLKRYPHPATLKVAVQAMQTPELKSEATNAVLVMAQKLGKDTDVKELLTKAGIERIKLEIVKAEYGSGTTQKDVTAIVRQRAGDLPLISLQSPSYNTNFGGDPVPGSTKQLKIWYRINGQEGNASFAEDAMIVLPLPK
ncbi:MAG: HEAT repeat domain-containing protein [Planctomycetota bacterium]